MPVNPLCILRAGELASRPPEDRWLIRPLWTRAAAGVLAGHPKTGKTFFALDMAVSVASNTPCLDRFSVADPGPALVYLAEDELALVRQRIEALCLHRELDIDGLDLHVIAEPVLRLDNAPDQTRLVEALERIRPRLLLIDPLIRVHSKDENRSDEMSGLLSFFRALQRRFDCAVILVHHSAKKERARPGQTLRGSSDIYAWIDSGAYLYRSNDRILLSVEHRSARPPEPVILRLVSRKDGSGARLEWAQESREEPTDNNGSLAERILDGLARNHPLTRKALRIHLRVNNQHLGRTLAALEEQGRICRVPDGWIPVRLPAADSPFSEDEHAEISQEFPVSPAQ